MAQQATLALFGDVPAPVMTRPHTPARDAAMALALAYEQAVIDCLAALADDADRQAQAEACAQFDKAMSAYTMLPRPAYRRAKRLLDRRGRITGKEWWEIKTRMASLTRAAMH